MTRPCDDPAESSPEHGPGGFGSGLRREELAAVARLLLRSAVAEVEQHRVEQASIDAAYLPARVEVAWQLLLGDEAAVQVNARASGAAQRRDGLEKPVK